MPSTSRTSIWCSIYQEASTQPNVLGRGHCRAEQCGGRTNPACCDSGGGCTGPPGNCLCIEADPRAVDYRDYYVAVLDAVIAANPTINTTFYGGTWTECGSCVWGNETILPLLAAVDPSGTKLNSTNHQLDAQGYPFGFSAGGASPVDLTTMQAKVRPMLTAKGYPANTKIYVNRYKREHLGTPICNEDDGCSPPFTDPELLPPVSLQLLRLVSAQEPAQGVPSAGGHQNISAAVWYTFDLAPTIRSTGSTARA